MSIKAVKWMLLLWMFTVVPAAAQDVERGVAMAKKGDLKGAEKILREALILNPNPARTHYELGRIYEKLGEYVKAIAEYKEGIEQFKQDGH